MSATATSQNEMIAIIRQVGGDPLDLPFWNAISAGKFLLHRCNVCKRSYWPASRCVEHGPQSMSWVESSGRGTLYTYTVMHHAYTPSMKGKTPYVVAVVKLDEGPFYHANLIDCPLDDVVVGMPLQAVMQKHETGLVVPMFQPVRS
jgi:uncharacterized OB-fold protein